MCLHNEWEKFVKLKSLLMIAKQQNEENKYD